MVNAGFTLKRGTSSNSTSSYECRGSQSIPTQVHFLTNVNKLQCSNRNWCYPTTAGQLTLQTKPMSSSVFWVDPPQSPPPLTKFAPLQKGSCFICQLRLYSCLAACWDKVREKNQTEEANKNKLKAKKSLIEISFRFRFRVFFAATFKRFYCMITLRDNVSLIAGLGSVPLALDI